MARLPTIILPTPVVVVNYVSTPKRVIHQRIVHVYRRAAPILGAGGGYNPPTVETGGSSPAEILGQWLINLAIAADPDTSNDDWPVYYGHLPDETDTPDNAISIYDTGGTDDGRTMVDGVRAEHPGFQVRLRASSYKIGYEKISGIQATMEGTLRTPVSLGGRTWLIENISLTGTIISLGVDRDKLRRDHFTLNGLLTLSEV